ncbi:hypothetical protein [Roseibium album]|uniref:hypothetical protein n=1 Tax=Roseibium album TaxID=311410 RepID=UPI001187513A|nr:hypothetical protein [Roseibium album]
MNSLTCTLIVLLLALSDSALAVGKKGPETVAIGGVSPGNYLFKDIRNSPMTADIGDGVMVYAVTLLARWSGPNEKKPGHAYIILSEWRQQGNAVFWQHPLLFGMNPEDAKKIAIDAALLRYKLVLKDRGAEAVLEDEKPAVAIQLWVDPAQYDAVLRKVEKWRGKTYTLTWSDCLSFVREVAAELNLNVPTRGVDYPVTNLKKILDAN